MLSKLTAHTRPASTCQVRAHHPRDQAPLPASVEVQQALEVAGLVTGPFERRLKV